MAGHTGEIATIEHELAMLRERYAIYQRGAVWARRTLVAAGLVIAGLILWRLVLGDVFGAALVVILCVIVAVGALPYRKRRLIDLVSITSSPMRSGSDAHQVERMIAQREKRLAKLQGHTP